MARNAATLPPGLVDAELFGNARNYPNPGAPERPGLIGQADGGTLFLDEIGEASHEVQAHLLRVLDAGEYHRLGEATARRADLRLIAATNRADSELKHDLCARLPLRVKVPDLDERREDIPLLCGHLLRHARQANPEIGARFFSRLTTPRLDPALVDHLVRRPYTTHVRELDAILWRAMTASTSDVVTLPAEPETTPPPSPSARARAAARPPSPPSRKSCAACPAPRRQPRPGGARARARQPLRAVPEVLKRHGDRSRRAAVRSCSRTILDESCAPGARQAPPRDVVRGAPELPGELLARLALQVDAPISAADSGRISRSAATDEPAPVGVIFGKCADLPGIESVRRHRLLVRRLREAAARALPSRRRWTRSSPSDQARRGSR